jgi:hypothetical protein
VQANRQAGAERGEYRFRRVRRGVVAEQVRRLVDHVRVEVAHIGQVAELAFAHGLGFQRDDRLRVGLALGGEGGKAFGIDGFEHGLGFQRNDFGHGMTP